MEWINPEKFHPIDKMIDTCTVSVDGHIIIHADNDRRVKEFCERNINLPWDIFRELYKQTFNCYTSVLGDSKAETDKPSIDSGVIDL